MSSAKNVTDEMKKLKGQPDSIDKVVQLGDLYLEQGDKLKAREAYQEAISKYPKNALGYTRMGVYAYDDADYEVANDYFQKAVDVDKKAVSAWVGLANVYMKKDGTARAIEMIERALKADSTHPDAVFTAGAIYLKTGDFYNAQKYLTQAATVEKSKYFPFAKFMLALIHAKQGFLLKAEQQFTALKSNAIFSDISTPNGLAFANNLGLVQFRLNKFADAEATLKEVTSKGKNVTANMWMNLALVYWRQDKIADATAALKKVNELNPGLWPWVNELDEYLKTGAKGLKEKIGKLMKTNPEGYNIGIYLGCIIPNRYPFIEAATRHFLDFLKIGVSDLEGASCCPAPGVFRSFDIETWLTVGSRNVVLSEEQNRDLVTMCNGCYGTLNDINTELKHDAEKKRIVNAHLAKINKQYKGNIQVRHIMDVIINEIGMDKIKDLIVNKLNLRVAVHYGCHIVKPTHNKPWKDSFEGPEFFDKLIELTGAQSVNYKDKLMCCGAGGAVRTGAKEVAIDFTKDKLINMREAGVDAIVLCCPFCHLQFDLGQTEVNGTFKEQIQEDFHIPVIYVTQLLGLAMGLDPFRMGLLRTPQGKGVPPFQPVEPIFAKYADLDL
jgi:heterodisulfide reductase subunit B